MIDQKKAISYKSLNLQEEPERLIFIKSESL
jgi:hypothetical protein